MPLVDGGSQPNNQTDTSLPTIKAAKETKNRRGKAAIVVTPFTVKELDQSPDESLNTAELAEYIRGQLKTIGGLYKKVAVHIFYLGEALVNAREQFKEEKRRDWTVYLNDIGISPATATRARQLYERVHSPEVLVGMTPTEAYEEFGILKPKLLTYEKPGGETTATDHDKKELPKSEKGEESGNSSVPAKVDYDTKAGVSNGGDLPEEELDIPEDELPEATAEDFSENEATTTEEEPPASVEEALAELTELEMESFVYFVNEIGSFNRVKAIIATCLESYAVLYGN